MIESADARFAVMGIISFIPYFNWMSWVFAWMDTSDNRYAAVYLAPYLRSKLSISPDESWLPITSILLCILHIQLEASIKNGDLQNFPLFKGKKDTTISQQETRKEEQKLPTSDDESRNKIKNWGIPRKPARQTDSSDEEGEERKKH